MTNFMVGDRVRCMRGFDGNELIKGAFGKVVRVSKSGTIISVEFDNFIEGHNGDGFGKSGHCWHVTTDVLFLCGVSIEERLQRRYANVTT